jgi:DnaJ-domain-containing protein 1
LSPEERNQYCPSCKAKFTASFSDGILSVTFDKRQQTDSSTDSTKDQLQITLEDAYRLFNADPGTPWEDIELVRRRLIQQYHPDKVAALGPKLREVAEIEGKRINIAFALIRQVRGL